MKRSPGILTLLLVLPFPVAARASDLSAADLAFFEGKVRPVLSKACYECHAQDSKKIKGGLLLDRKAGWVKGGDSGEVIVPGKPDESMLIRMIEHDPDYDAMPPKSKLTVQEITDLREWVKRGAPDPRDEAIGEEILADEFDLEERKQWWSLQPVKEVAPPAVRAEEWATNEIDRFLLAEIEKQGWQPSPAAGREHLLRRVSLVLTGLAPTEQELAEFLADDSPQAYEKVVDRLLASPHFGERWARHWMDVVRFAETKAFEADYTMPYVDRFRDYLIRAFNQDVPYDQFVREALAGDLLPEPRLDPVTAANESVAGPGFLYLTDGQHGPPDIHGDEARVFDSIIQVVGVAFQGLTVSCARCHDHKFDAITERDYYSLYGILRSSRLHYANTASPLAKETGAKRLREAKRGLMSEAFRSIEDEGASLAPTFEAVRAVQALPEHAGRVKQRRAKLAKGESEEGRIKAFHDAVDADVAAAAKRHGADPKLVLRWVTWAAGTSGGAELAGLREGLAGKEPGPGRVETSNPAYRFGLEADSLGEWIATGPGVTVAAGDGFVPALTGDRLLRGAVGTGAVTGTLSPRLEGVIRSPDFILDGKPVELWVRGRNAAVHLVVRNYELAGYGPTTNRLRVEVNSDQWRKVGFATNLWAGEPAYLEVQHHGAAMKCLPRNARPAAPSDEAWVAVAAGDLPAWGEVWRRGPAAETIAALGAVARTGELDPAAREVLGALVAEGLIASPARHPKLEAALEDYRALAAELPEAVYHRSVVDGQQHDQPVYVRGDHKNISKEPNPRRFLDGLDGEPLSSPGSGRLEWARAIADPANPLTARVRVNRIWSRVFGRGLVSSLDDFGVMGELPSHPELLDYLAGDFTSNGWSTKNLVRKLVLSSAFRSSTTPGPGVATADPKNIYLSHMPVRRMDAESIRDHILACSGALKRDLHGPSVPPNVDDQPNSRAKPRSGPLDGNGRRSVYLEMRRNYLPSFLRVFDLPIATEPVGGRNVTNVPAQSLALMNDRFVHEQSRVWARSLLARQADLDERLRVLHRQAFSREATGDELVWGRRVLAELGGEESEEAWAALCHLMINRKEFIYVF